MSNNQLDDLRKKINGADLALLEQLANRMNIVREIGMFKKQHHIPSLQASRWQAVLEKNCETGKKLGLGEDLITDLWERIHQEALRIESAVNEQA